MQIEPHPQITSAIQNSTHPPAGRCLPWLVNQGINLDRISDPTNHVLPADHRGYCFPFADDLNLSRHTSSSSRRPWHLSCSRSRRSSAQRPPAQPARPSAPDGVWVSGTCGWLPSVLFVHSDIACRKSSLLPPRRGMQAARLCTREALVDRWAQGTRLHRWSSCRRYRPCAGVALGDGAPAMVLGPAVLVAKIAACCACAAFDYNCRKYGSRYGGSAKVCYIPR